MRPARVTRLPMGLAATELVAADLLVEQGTSAAETYQRFIGQNGKCQINISLIKLDLEGWTAVRQQLRSLCLRNWVAVQTQLLEVWQCFSELQYVNICTEF